MDQDTSSSSSTRGIPLHGVSEANVTASMRVVKEHLDALRRHAGAPIVVMRVRPTRHGWAVVYREGSLPEQAFQVDARDGQTRTLAVDQVALRWSRAP